MKIINVRKDGTITDNLVVPKELMERVVACSYMHTKKMDLNEQKTKTE